MKATGLNALSDQHGQPTPVPVELMAKTYSVLLGEPHPVSVHSTNDAKAPIVDPILVGPRRK